MSGVVFSPDTSETRYKFNQLARHQLIRTLHSDILADMKVCELEGWDKTEYIKELYGVLEHFKERIEPDRKEEECRSINGSSKPKRKPDATLLAKI